MKPHPVELRERIVTAVDQQMHTIAEVAELFSVTESYVYKLLRLRRDCGDLNPLPHSGGTEPILNENRLLVFAEIIAEFPDATLTEYKDLLRRRCRVDVCLTTIWPALQKMEFTLKKRRAGQRKQTRR